MTERQTTIVILDELDHSGSAIVSCLVALSERRLISDVFVVHERAKSDSRPTARISARVVGPDIDETCELFDRLATWGETGHVRVVGLSATSDPANPGDERVSRLVSAIKTRLVELMGTNLAITDARLAVRGAGEPIPSPQFFSTDASCNLVLIPQDRRSDYSIARPIERGEGSGSEAFVFHGATELVGLLGLWVGMDSAPIDRFVPQVAGVDTPFVRFVQSRTRVMHAPALPMSDIAATDRALPLPPRFLAVGASSRTVSEVAARIYPEMLRFVPGDEPRSTTYVRGGVRALLRFFGELMRSTLLLPRTIVRGVRDEFDRAAAEVHQEFVGRDSRLRILGVGDDSADQTVGVDIEALLTAAEVVDRQDVLSPIDRSSWTSILDRIFGIVDGDPNTAELRRDLFGNDVVVVADRPALGTVGHASLPLIIGELDGVGTEEASPSSNQGAEDIGIQSSEPRTEAIAPPWSEVASRGEIHLPGDDCLEGLGDPIQDAEIGSPRRNSSERRLGDEEPILHVDVAASIPRAVTREFESEIAVARSYLADTVAAIRSRIGRLQGAPGESVSSIVAVAAWVSLLVLMFVAATCTPLYQYLDFIPRGVTRDAVWTSVSSCFVVAALMLLGIGGGRRSWQIRALVTAAAVGSFLSLVFIFFAPLRDFVRADRNSWAAVAVGAGTIVLILVAAVRSMASRSRARREIGRVFLLAGTIYVWLGLLFQQVSKGSFLQDNQAVRSRLLVAGTIIPASILIGCMAVVATTRMRQRYALRDGAARLEWLRAELDAAIDFVRRLELARRQWLVTAAVVMRFLSFPLGKPPESRRGLSVLDALEDRVLKFDVARLDLSQRGREGLLARLRRHFVEMGWLSRQYEKAVRGFAADRAHALGLMSDEIEDIRPEWDPETDSVEAIRSGETGTDRLKFAIALYQGRYDNHLAEVPQGLSLDGVYQSILDDFESYTVTGSQSGRVSARGFLEQVVPTADLELPTGLVTKTFIAGDPQRRLSSDLWWPAKLVGELGAANGSCRIHEADCDVDRIGRDETVLVGVRVDISEPFRYFECIGAQEVTKPLGIETNTAADDGF